MARVRDELGRTVDDVDFDLTLTDVLDRLQVTRQIDTENPNKRKWSIPGRFLGSFDAHEGWCVLRHYNRCGHWGIAIREAQGELHHGYDYEP
jgi:hypothetical protein